MSHKCNQRRLVTHFSNRLWWWKARRSTLLTSRQISLEREAHYKLRLQRRVDPSLVGVYGHNPAVGKRHSFTRQQRLTRVLQTSRCLELALCPLYRILQLGFTRTRLQWATGTTHLNRIRESNLVFRISTIRLYSTKSTQNKSSIRPFSKIEVKLLKINFAFL